MTLSRRSFAQLIGGAAAVAAMPRLLEAAPPADAATGWVRLSNNENPYGPSAAALNAVRQAFPIACRYPDAVLDDLVAAIAALHQVSPDQVLVGAGSGQLLKLSALAFTSGTKALVTAHPTFEALGHHASTHGAEVRRVPLTKMYGHDLTKILEESSGAGLVYICNPNNPTATITPDVEVRRFIAAVPATTTVLVDEAYHHYVSSPAYASVMDLVAKHANLVVLRTFSKIFGMAGMRCGYAIGQAATLRAMRVDQGWDPVSALSLAAARASLADNRHVADQKRINTEIRAWTVGELRRLGFTVLPSEANFIMVNMGQDVRPLIAAMRTRDVEVGRLFPAMSDHMRVTIGKPDEMRRFMAELQTVLDRAVRAA
jgi:histidinol-phosphate aminotransferase